jgi:hypothetical protein
MTGLLTTRPGLSCGLLLVTTIALAAALHRATAGLPGPAESVTGPAAAPLPPLDLLRFEPPSAEDFIELADRPPFSPTRRPPAPRPVAAPKPPPPPSPPAPPSFRLVGVGIPDGGGPGRVLLERKGAKAEWLGEGESIDGWRVVTVEPRSVRLRDERLGRPDLVLELRHEQAEQVRPPRRPKLAPTPARPRQNRAPAAAGSKAPLG